MGKVPLHMYTEKNILAMLDTYFDKPEFKDLLLLAKKTPQKKRPDRQPDAPIIPVEIFPPACE